MGMQFKIEVGDKFLENHGSLIVDTFITMQLNHIPVKSILSSLIEVLSRVGLACLTESHFRHSRTFSMELIIGDHDLNWDL